MRDGQEALDYLFYQNKYKDREPSLPAFVLLDIKMPKIDGIEVLKVLRNAEKYKNLPVVMLTSSQMESDVIKVTNWVQMDLLSNPLNSMNL